MPQKTHADVLVVPKMATSTTEAIATTTESTLHKIVSQAAVKYGVDPLVMDEVIECESQWNPVAVSPTADYGLVQIHLAAHPDITKAQADNPVFAANWMAEEFKEGHENAWTCYRTLKSIKDIK